MTDCISHSTLPPPNILQHSLNTITYSLKYLFRFSVPKMCLGTFITVLYSTQSSQQHSDRHSQVPVKSLCNYIPGYIELNTGSKEINNNNNNNNKLFSEYFWACIQNAALFHPLIEDGKAASSRVPYLSLNERKIGRLRLHTNTKASGKLTAGVAYSSFTPNICHHTLYFQNKLPTCLLQRKATPE